MSITKERIVEMHSGGLAIRVKHQSKSQYDVFYGRMFVMAVKKYLFFEFTEMDTRLVRVRMAIELSARPGILHIRTYVETFL